MISTHGKGPKDATGVRETRCQQCRARCTIGTDGTTEYGHQYGCPNRPETLPGGATS